MTEFPQSRPRRLRRTQTMRNLVQETRLSAKGLVYPLFVVHGRGKPEEIEAMPGTFRFPLEALAREVEEVWSLGIPAVLLFGLGDHKDETGSEAYDPKGIVQEAIRTVKKAAPELLVITDVCLCEYTSHGHCGLVVNGEVDNDQTLGLLAQTALTHARAGADVVAPSAMMDGQVAAIRKALDGSEYGQVPIMAYAAKYASAFFGPFREAAASTPQFGDRRGYQMDPSNIREALREVEQDILEGADMIMVKPALAYLDVISRVRAGFTHPLAAYNVSGEYSLIKAAARNGWIDEERTVTEVLTGIRRAGADIIITYHAKDVARWLTG